MFSKCGTYPAVGLFSITHIVTILICVFLVTILVIYTKKMTQKQYQKLLLISAIVLTAMEIFKIVWSLANGYTNINSWVPLYFCSLFLYALWLAQFKNKFIKDLGLSYIAFAGLICGLIFVIMPTTSFNNYPIFHFQCIYSMLYHSAMMYSSVMLFVTKSLEINFKAVKKYCLFCFIFMVLAIILNISFKGNLMFLSDPGVIPLSVLRLIYAKSQMLFTLIIILAHMSLGFVVWGITSALGYSKRGEQETE